MATATDYKIADADDPILEMSLKNLSLFLCTLLCMLLSYQVLCSPIWYTICLFSEYQNFPT